MSNLYTNPLKVYNDSVAKHLFISEFNESNENLVLHLKNLQCSTKTNAPLVDTIHFYLIFSKMVERKPFFFSKAQQRYQTVNVNEIILHRNLSPRESFVFLHQLTLSVFEHQIQNDMTSYVKFSPYKISLLIESYPMLFNNKSALFQLLFNSQIAELSMSVTFQFNRKNIQKQLCYMQYFRLINTV